MTRKTSVSLLILALCGLCLRVPARGVVVDVALPDVTLRAVIHRTLDRPPPTCGYYPCNVCNYRTALKRTPQGPRSYSYFATPWGTSKQGARNIDPAQRPYQDEIEDYIQVITLAPEHPESYLFAGRGHLRLARVARSVGTSQQARHHAQAVKKIGHLLTDFAPENADGWQLRGVADYELGLLAADKGDWEAAACRYAAGFAAYNQAVALDPENPAPYASRGAVRRSVGLLEMVRSRIKKAQSHYQAALADHQQAVCLAAPEYTLLFSEGIRRARVRLGETEVALGNIEAAQRHYRGAIAACDEMLRVEIGDYFTGRVYQERAEAKLRLGESEILTGTVQQAEHHYRSAIADCDHVLTLAKNKLPAFYTRGRAKAALSDYTAAISDFDRVIRIQSDHALAYYARGLAKQARGPDVPGDDIGLDFGALADLIEGNVGEVLEQDVTVDIVPGESLVAGKATSAAADFQKAKTLNPNVAKLYPFGHGHQD